MFSHLFSVTAFKKTLFSWTFPRFRICQRWFFYINTEQIHFSHILARRPVEERHTSLGDGGGKWSKEKHHNWNNLKYLWLSTLLEKKCLKVNWIKLFLLTKLYSSWMVIYGFDGEASEVLQPVLPRRSNKTIVTVPSVLKIYESTSFLKLDAELLPSTSSRFCSQFLSSAVKVSSWGSYGRKGVFQRLLPWSWAGLGCDRHFKDEELLFCSRRKHVVHMCMLNSRSGWLQLTPRQVHWGIFCSCGKALKNRMCSFLSGFRALRIFLKKKKKNSSVAETQNLEMSTLMVLDPRRTGTLQLCVVLQSAFP